MKPDVKRDPWASVLEDAFRELRREGASITDAFDVIATVIRNKFRAEAEKKALSKPDHLMVQSIIGAATGEPAVQFRVGFEQWQWDVATAREHASAVLNAAEAAVHDAATFRWLTLGDLGLDRDVAMCALLELRRFRGDVDREDWRVPDE